MSTVWWSCENGHCWRSTPGCPYCALEGAPIQKPLIMAGSPLICSNNCASYELDRVEKSSVCHMAWFMHHEDYRCRKCGHQGCVVSGPWMGVLAS